MRATIPGIPEIGRLLILVGLGLPLLGVLIVVGLPLLRLPGSPLGRP